MATVAQARAVKDRHEAELLALPRVSSLAVGNKIIAGRRTSEIAIKVLVSRKLPPEDLAEGERVPERIEGVPTDVEVLAPIEAF